jgi:guanylate kinase
MLKLELLRTFPDLHRIVPHTTRAMRIGEVDGREYHFVSGEEFTQLVKNEKMLWWAQVGPTQRSGTHLDEFRVSAYGAIVDVLPEGAQFMRKRVEELGGRSLLLFVTASEKRRRLRIRKREANISDEGVERLISEDPVRLYFPDRTLFNEIVNNDSDSPQSAQEVVRELVGKFLA